MQVQTSTGKSIHQPAEVAERVDYAVNHTLGHLTDQLTRVEVHVDDENSIKHGAADKRCMMEARLKGHQPIAVTHHADSYELAINGAVNKLKRSLQSTIGRLRER